MKLSAKLYNRNAPYYIAEYTIFELAFKPIRKWLVNTISANCPFNSIRIAIYKMCEFKIGKHVFIGMKCYLDDHCYKFIKIEDNVTISYGVFLLAMEASKNIPIF